MLPNWVISCHTQLCLACQSLVSDDWRAGRVASAARATFPRIEIKHARAANLCAREIARCRGALYKKMQAKSKLLFAFL